jgi:hypothetical protein
MTGFPGPRLSIRAPSLSTGASNPYIQFAGHKSDMAINGHRNKPFGPGGGTRRLHRSPLVERVPAGAK